MNDKKDEFKECIAREFEEIAREEEEFLENDTSLVVPEGTKEAVLARVREQIRAYEMEQARKETEEREEAINHLSEEDREALELGRKMLKAGIGQNDPEEPSGKKVRRKKKPLKMYLALAAVIVCVLAMGITSMGGPERIVRMMTQDVGDREVEKVSTSHKIKMIESEDEEKALIEREVENGADGIIVQLVSSEDTYAVFEKIDSSVAVMLLETDAVSEGVYSVTAPDNLWIGEALAQTVLQDYGDSLSEKKSWNSQRKPESAFHAAEAWQREKRCWRMRT